MTPSTPVFSARSRGVRSFDTARPLQPGLWQFDWRFEDGDQAFRGHFPHQPILPGVFLVEMAQRACEHALLADTGAPHRVVQVRRMRFLGPVLPGDPCSLRVEWPAEEPAAEPIALKVAFSKAGQRLAEGVLGAVCGEAP